MQTGFWWILLSLLIYGAVHSLLAGLKTKKWVKEHLGSDFYRRYYRLFFSIQAAILFVPVLALTALLPDRLIYRIPSPWVWITTSIQIGAVLLMVRSVMLTGAMRFIGLAQAVDPDQAEKSLPLVKGSLYRYVRHPIYTTTFIFIWLVPQMSWNTMALNIGVTVYTLIGALFEERKLIREFGEDYKNYRKNTPFIIPFLKF
jgi:protein-S-isoprenylcysteine O-methyltransferase Ste14